MRWSHVSAAAAFAAGLVLPVNLLSAQPQDPPAQEQEASTSCDCIVVPALILVDIAIMAPLSSATSKDGETFPIKLASPIIIEGREVIPAGVTGLGEVIHAQKSGMGGGGGELLLAARYLEVDGRRMRLRSFQAGRYGKNQTGTALVTSFFAGPFGLAVKGKNTEFAAGSIASAKTAEAFTMPLSALPPPTPAETGALVSAPSPAETESASTQESNP